MNERTAVRLAFQLAAVFLVTDPLPAADRAPNVVIVLCDNLGYGDLGCYGSKVHKTPAVDRLAAEGMTFTAFYSASGVCTPSRASLMTGCYPRRVGMHHTTPDGAVLRPVSPNGLHPEETTIAEILQTRGYATACIGKWHLGDQPEFLPTRQGFDRFFGIPYSDDMTPRPEKNWPPLPLMENERVIEAPVDRALLTRRYTERAVDFVTENRDRPFFLYLAHAMPGSTASPFASPAFQGRSANGAYGDSVEEIDWSTEEILAALDRLELSGDTLVVWTSDNGAPRRDPPQGSNLPLSGWGYSTAEGGMRVPCLMRWPDRIPAGKTCDELATMMDLLPTVAHIVGASPPEGRAVDGHDIRPLMFGRAGAKSPYEAFYYYNGPNLEAVRSGTWKLYLPLQQRAAGRASKTADARARLYDLQADVAEKSNVAADHPDVVARLTSLARQAQAELGDGTTPGRSERPAGRTADPRPQLLSTSHSD